MTSANVYLGIRLTQNDFKRIEMDNTDLEMKVDLFKDNVTKCIGVEKNLIGLKFNIFNLSLRMAAFVCRINILWSNIRG